MSLKDIAENLDKVENYFKYAEKESQVSSVIHFGWQEASEEDVDFDEPMIYSYHSNSKFATDQERVWSKKAGDNLSSLSDYQKYFVSLTGDEPEDFLKKWGYSDEVLKAYWETKFPTELGQHKFVKKLAELLVGGKKFIMYSRGYILIDPKK